MIVFRNTDIDVPYLWETNAQPAARWHGPGAGPAQYFSSTPEAAWAEFCRHNEIRDPEDLDGINRALWAVEIDDAEPSAVPPLSPEVMIGARYAVCQLAAASLRSMGATRLEAPSAAVEMGSPSGWRVDGRPWRGPQREERTIVLYGRRPELIGWRACAPGRPGPEVTQRTRAI